MVYKKYIKKNGKVYGPYYYHSRRVNGKVVSEYRGGTEKKLDYKKFVLPVLGVLVLALLVYTAFQIEFPTISGNVVLDFGATYQEGEPLSGKLDLFLNEGEFVPAASKVIFSTETQYYEYLLSDLVSDSSLEGEYYVSKSSLSGSGSGFGQAGVKEVYPDVYFEYEVYSISEEVPETSAPSEPVNIETPEEPAQEETPTEEELPVEEEPIEEASEEPSIEEPEEVSEEPTSEPEPVLSEVVSNLFLALTPTGNVVAEFDTSGEGELSYGETFVIGLAEGQEIEIVSGSVYTESGELADDVLDLEIKEDQAIITTSYFEEVSGFGKDYLGLDIKELSMNLDGLNMILDAGDLEISVVHGSEEIVSISTVLGEGYVEAQEGELVSEPEETQDPIPPLTHEPESSLDVPEELTEQEKIILENAFGDKEVEISKEKLEGDRILIIYELDDQYGEFVYDASLSKEELAEQMNADKILWLKEVANSI